MYLLALYGVLLETGRGDEIEALAGDSEEGRMLVATHITMQAGREAEAEAAWRAVIETGRSGRRQLGDLLAGQPGREAEAEASYRDAIASGEANSWRALGHLLARQPGREADAEHALRAAIAEREQSLAELADGDPGDAAAETFRDMWTARSSGPGVTSASCSPACPAARRKRRRRCEPAADVRRPRTRRRASRAARSARRCP